MPKKDDKLARICKVMAVNTRVQIIRILRQRTLCVNALAARLGVTQGAVSQHLRIMRDAGLVIDERRGYHVHYRLDEETIVQWRTEINALLAPLDDAAQASNTKKEGVRLCASMKNNQ